MAAREPDRGSQSRQPHQGHLPRRPISTTTRPPRPRQSHHRGRPLDPRRRVARAHHRRAPHRPRRRQLPAAGSGANDRRLIAQLEKLKHAVTLQPGTSTATSGVAAKRDFSSDPRTLPAGAVCFGIRPSVVDYHSAAAVALWSRISRTATDGEGRI
jgi:hypothetical protein